MIPDETEIRRVMVATGMARMQAINHLRQRATLAQRTRRGRAQGYITDREASENLAWQE